MDIPLDVEVYCTDGPGGSSITTISNPITEKITYLVVTEKEAPYIKRLVPIEMVKKTTPQSICLNCTRKDLSKVEQLKKFLLHPIDKRITHLVLQKGPEKELFSLN